MCIMCLQFEPIFIVLHQSVQKYVALDAIMKAKYSPKCTNHMCLRAPLLGGLVPYVLST